MVAHFHDDKESGLPLGVMDGVMAEAATQAALQWMHFDPVEVVLAHCEVDARIALKLVN
jgi:hypothetical protein